MLIIMSEGAGQIVGTSREGLGGRTSSGLRFLGIHGPCVFSPYSEGKGLLSCISLVLQE